jgi:hypothetical protein
MKLGLSIDDINRVARYLPKEKGDLINYVHVINDTIIVHILLRFN